MLSHGLHRRLTGIPPFAGQNDEESFRLTVRGQYDPSPLKSLSAPGELLSSVNGLSEPSGAVVIIHSLTRVLIGIQLLTW